ncbi:MAG: hypothetical protein ABIH37_00955 [archaeon]
MKEVICLLIITLLIFSIAPALVIADDEDDQNLENIDTQTQVETEIMDSSIGAQIRILQLQRQLQLKLLHMQAVVDVLNAKSADTTALTGISEELKLLINEAKTIPTTNTEEAVKQFVEIKLDAKDLVKQFREITSTLLTNEDKEALRLRIREINDSELQEIKNQIKDLNNGLNIERLRKTMQHMSIEDEALIAQVESGEITAKQAFEQLKEQHKALIQEKKQESRENFIQEKIQRRTQQIDKITEIKTNRLNTIQERLQERAQILEQKGFENASLRLQNRADEFENKIQNVEEKGEALKNKAQQKGVNNE